MPLRSNAAVTRDWVRALAATQRLFDTTRETGDAALARVVHEFAAAQGDAPALIGSDETLTYMQLSQRLNRYARWALAEGLAPGDVVALDLGNRPDYAAIWLGLSQVGCVVALLNTNLAADVAGEAPRARSSRSRAPSARSMRRALARDRESCGCPGRRALAAAAEGHRSRAADLHLGHHGPAQGDQRHPCARVGMERLWFAGMMEAVPQDRLFDCLPMYHSVGGVVAVGSMLAAGGATIVRERFSASGFWPDVAASGATIVQYIGELCRYLLLAPPSAADTQHRVRLAVGNGLHADVWEPFERRFHLPRILEFYAASEGAVSFTNAEGRPGALGRVPAFLRDRVPGALIAVDPQTSEPGRAGDGRCRRVATGEPGEAIGKLSGTARFDGYTDARGKRTAKILHDVFEPGDRWYRTGDLLRQDAAGFFYFVDRLGDTFRWKGENVSTTEVAAVLRACPGVLDAAVYGVALAGADGKAGMAALVVDAAFDLRDRCTSFLRPSLPAYARPLFVRLCPRTRDHRHLPPAQGRARARGLCRDRAIRWWKDDGKAFLPN